MGNTAIAVRTAIESFCCGILKRIGVGAAAVDPETHTTAIIKKAEEAAAAKEREACGKLCEEMAMSFLRDEIRMIREDEWPDDFSTVNNEPGSEKQEQAETVAKATAWLMMRCAVAIRKRSSTDSPSAPEQVQARGQGEMFWGGAERPAPHP